MPPDQVTTEEEFLNPDPVDTGDNGGDAEEDARLDAQARAQGWRPESEWDDDRAQREGRRKPVRFLTAREFLAKADGSNTILRERNGEMAKKLTDMAAQIADLHVIVSEQRKMSRDGMKRAYEQGMAEATAKMRQAVKDGDEEGFDKAKALHDNLVEQAKADPLVNSEDRPAQQQQRSEGRQDAMPQDMADWIFDNPWFQSNPELNRAMIDADTEAVRLFPNMPIRDRLEKSALRVRKQFPRHFNDPVPQQRRSSTVSQPTNSNRETARGSDEADFARISKEDQATYFRHRDQFKRQFPNSDYTKREFLDEYFNPSGARRA